MSQAKESGLKTFSAHVYPDRDVFMEVEARNEDEAREIMQRRFRADDYDWGWKFSIEEGPAPY